MKVTAEIANALNSMCKAQSNAEAAQRELNIARTRANEADQQVKQLEKIIYDSMPNGSQCVLVEEQGKLFRIDKDSAMNRLTVTRPAVYQYGK
jgi:hypothetical protein